MSQDAFGVASEYQIGGNSNFSSRDVDTTALLTVAEDTGWLAMEVLIFQNVLAFEVVKMADEKKETYEGIDVTIRVPKMWIDFLVDFYKWSGHDSETAKLATSEFIQVELARALQNEIRAILRRLADEYPLIYNRFAKKYPRLARSVSGRVRLLREGYAKIE